MKYILPLLVVLFLTGCSHKAQKVNPNLHSDIYKFINPDIPKKTNPNSKELIKKAVKKEKGFLMGIKEYVQVFFKDTFKRKLKVSASAYNSLKAQTDNTPNIAAWGDTLKPGMKVIAVSRDLLKMGLRHNTPVRIKGLDGIYIVKDKMNKRWRKKIDIYMGVDRRKALKWGRKNVEIMW